MGGLLGLLGLLLAFTFGMAGARFDQRKTLVVEEANAIGTAWLRTDLVPEPMRAQARDVLREYTHLRLEAASREPATVAPRPSVRSEQLQGPSGPSPSRPPRPRRRRPPRSSSPR